ncbi:hypothetical protein P262_p2111 (plasmid) [Cronobacter malonaticus]|nr:hypothetical protein P262_p2111 [Cronobacter malonaticus]
MTVSRARRFEGSAIWKVCEPPFMPFGHVYRAQRPLSS